MKMNKEILRLIRSGTLEELSKVVSREDALATDDTENERGLIGTYLHYCIAQNRLDLAQFMLSLGANPNHRGGVWRANPITYAASRGQLDMINLLRQNGGRFDTLARPFINPLFAAIRNGQIETVKYLVDEGVDPNLVYRVDQGKLFNALLCAKQQRQPEIVEFLDQQGCREPVEGEDKPVWEFAPQQNTEPVSDYDNVIEYMAERFGPVDELGLQEIVPVVEGVSVTINVVPPNDEHPFLVLFTNGMSDLPMSGHEDWQYAELVMHLPTDWPHPRDVEPDSPSLWPVKLLRQLAYHPHLAGTCYMPPAAFVAEDPPEPFGDTNFTCAFLAPRFANLQIPLQMDDGRTVNVFTVIPLHTAERDYEVNNGLDAFFDKFIESKVPMTVDPQRPSFA